MKKGDGEIKRRKRVVPAPSPQHAKFLAPAHSNPVFVESADKLASSTAGAPVPVDFTTYRPTSPASSTGSGGGAPEHQDDSTPTVYRGRKRRHGEANITPTHQQQLFDAAAETAAEETNRALDPALQSSHALPSRDHREKSASKEKQAWLQSERERLRAQLAAVEAQLAQDDDS
jgi:hypothetical protein